MKRAHFIGIGGIGMSALARYFLSEGWAVSGSDAAPSDITDALERAGVAFYRGHHQANIRGDVKLVIYSAAVRRANPERKAALTLGIACKTYAEVLGELTKKYFTIAVSGSHGKSTTTALLALLLRSAGLDPTVIVGTKLKEFGGTNFRKGKSKLLVLEADEWNRSFHKYRPQVAVLTNIDKEHLDTYENLKGVIEGFRTYLLNLPEGGRVIANWKDVNIRKAVATAENKRKLKVIFYNKKKFPKHPLQILGAMNQVNAEAAFTAAKLFGVKRRDAAAVFKSFRGTWRRLEKLKPSPMSHVRPERGRRVSCLIYSDYAHHPTEIKATLKALREKYDTEKLICVFEPHQEDRLNRLFGDFVHSFDSADVVILMPTYAVTGRERGGEKDSFALAQKISAYRDQTFYAHNLGAAIKLLQPFFENPDAVIVFMGAGTIDQHVRTFLADKL